MFFNLTLYTSSIESEAYSWCQLYRAFHRRRSRRRGVWKRSKRGETSTLQSSPRGRDFGLWSGGLASRSLGPTQKLCLWTSSLFSRIPTQPYPLTSIPMDSEAWSFSALSTQTSLSLSLCQERFLWFLLFYFPTDSGRVSTLYNAVWEWHVRFIVVRVVWAFW